MASDGTTDVALGDWLRDGAWVQVPTGILHHPNLSPMARLAWVTLAMGHRDKRQTLIAETMGCSETALRGYLRELETHGAIRRQRRGQGRADRYSLAGIDY